MPKVLIIQSEMKRYRLPFFTGLYESLRHDGIELTVAYSNSHLKHALRGDSVELPAHIGRRVTGRWFFGRLLYQPLWKEIMKADLVITGPEIKYLTNPILIVLSRLGLKRVAFWGLGPNRHPDRSPTAEWIKALLFTHVNWWFAYTQSIAEYLEEHGMPAERITTVQNSTDTRELRRLIASVSDEEARLTKDAVTGSSQSVVGLYCGLIGEIKAIPLLLEAARLVKKKLPEFHLLIIGNGPGRAELERAIAGEHWIHYLGSVYDRESALYYKISSAFLIAGTAGLGVVESFAAGLPFLGTRLPTHPPEISYVVEGENGCIAEHDARAFADAIVEVLSNPALTEHLSRGAREAGSHYTMETMIDNFRSGIKTCLSYRRLAGQPRLSLEVVPNEERQRTF